MLAKLTGDYQDPRHAEPGAGAGPDYRQSTDWGDDGLAPAAAVHQVCDQSTNNLGFSPMASPDGPDPDGVVTAQPAPACSGGALAVVRAWYGGPRDHRGQINLSSYSGKTVPWLWSEGNFKGKFVTEVVRYGNYMILGPFLTPFSQLCKPWEPHDVDIIVIIITE